MRVSDAIDQANNCLRDYRMSFYNKRSRIEDKDFAEEGECLEKHGVSLQKLTPYQLQSSLQGKQEMLAVRNQEIKTLRKQFAEVQKKHAAEIEQMKTVLAKAEKNVTQANHGKNMLREQNSELKRKLDEKPKDTGKRMRETDMDARPVVSLTLFDLYSFFCMI